MAEAQSEGSELARALGQLLRYRRRSITPEISQDRASDVAGVSRIAISEYERGKYLPVPAVLLRLCDLYKTTPEELGVAIIGGRVVSVDVARAHGSQPPPESIPAASTSGRERESRLPYMGEIPAGDWAAPTSQEETIRVDERFVADGRMTGTVYGHSMEPLIMDRDFLILQASRISRDGAIILAENTETRERTLKALARNGKDFVLRPVNPDHDEPKCDTWRMIAYLRAIQRVNEHGAKITIEPAEADGPLRVEMLRKPE